jgi:hypothetical protein
MVQPQLRHHCGLCTPPLNHSSSANKCLTVCFLLRGAECRQRLTPMAPPSTRVAAESMSWVTHPSPKPILDREGAKAQSHIRVDNNALACVVLQQDTDPLVRPNTVAPLPPMPSPNRRAGRQQGHYCQGAQPLRMGQALRLLRPGHQLPCVPLPQPHDDHQPHLLW